MQHNRNENKGKLSSYLNDPGNRSALEVLGGLGLIVCSGGNSFIIGAGTALAVRGLLENQEAPVNTNAKTKRVNLR